MTLPATPPADAHRVHPLAVDEAVDGDVARPVLGQAGEDGRGRVDRVLADPRAGAVRAHAVRAHDRAQVAVAAALDRAVGGFAEDREVAREQVGARARETRRAR